MYKVKKPRATLKRFQHSKIRFKLNRHPLTIFFKVSMCNFLVLLCMSLCDSFVLLSGIASSREYEVGQTLKYSYSSTVLLNEPSPTRGKDVGFSITGEVGLTTVWQNPEDGRDKLLKLQFDQRKLLIKSRKAPTPEGFIQHSSKLDSYPNYPIYFRWKEGKVSEVYSVKGDPVSMVNVKKGIISLFQYRTKAGRVREEDTSGACDVHYTIPETDSIIKRKSNCVLTKPVKRLERSEEALSPEINYSHEATVKLFNGQPIVESVQTKERHTMAIKLWMDVSGRVTSDQTLTYTGQEGSGESWGSSSSVGEALKRLEKREVKRGDLTADLEHQTCHRNCQSLEKLVTILTPDLNKENVAKLRGSSAYLQLLSKFRSADKKLIKSVLTSHKESPILPQLLDVAAGAQTAAAHEAAIDLLKLKSFDADLMERYLLALSLPTHPDEAILKDLLKLCQKKIRDEKVYQTLILTLASVANSFCKTTGNCQKAIVGDIDQFLTSKLDTCKDDSCVTFYLRSLKNFRHPGHLDTVLRLLATGSKKVSVEAVKMLQAMPRSVITPEVLTRLEGVFHQVGRKYDSSARAIAVDIILQNNPNQDTLKNILTSLWIQQHHDLNMFVLQRLRDLCSRDQVLQDNVVEVFKDPKVFNYYNLAQKGMSTAFTRSLYSHPVNGNSTFTSVLEMGGGMLKRSVFDVIIQKHNASLHLLSFNLFASGLSSFSSNGNGHEEQEGEDDPATAGMELSLMGVQLRPYVFFTGQGELMGLVWSGAGSEPTTALQSTVLLHDHHETVTLQNGFTTSMVMTGAISFDFTGQIQISLWNRNSHSLVENSAAVITQGLLNVESEFIRSHIEFNLGVEAKIDFVSDLDFYNKVALCLQMKQPDFHLRHTVRKVEEIPDKQHKLRKIIRRKYLVPGKTYALNQKNSQVCSEMFDDS